jgi:hypothetical protein
MKVEKLLCQHGKKSCKLAQQKNINEYERRHPSQQFVR